MATNLLQINVCFSRISRCVTKQLLAISTKVAMICQCWDYNLYCDWLTADTTTLWFSQNVFFWCKISEHLPQEVFTYFQIVHDIIAAT